ncbi:hypothetical protein C8R44DRAFT_863211 [Mycena epipterygia]|nr:hypothetical protein C8R44DRAFT_863211 [Mycena epipterygia]
MSGSGPTYYDELKRLHRLLKSLPDTISTGTVHNFADYRPDPERVKFTGSVQSVVSHSLEVSFGPRKEPGPTEKEIIVAFKSRGAGLEEVVSFLRDHITGNAGENLILAGWVDSLTKAATATLELSDWSESSLGAEGAREPSGMASLGRGSR